MTDAADGVTAGTPHTTPVVGAAGVGKTRLVRELTARVTERGWTVLAGACQRHTDEPYSAVQAALSDVV